MSNMCRSLILLAVGVLLAGCASVATYPPEEAPTRVLTTSTPFYRLDPVQEHPNEYLTKGTLVQLVRKSLGYSLVRKENGTTGYVPNANLAKTARDFVVYQSSSDAQKQAAAATGKKKSNSSNNFSDEDFILPNFSINDDIVALPQDQMPALAPPRSSWLPDPSYSTSVQEKTLPPQSNDKSAPSLPPSYTPPSLNGPMPMTL